MALNPELFMVFIPAVSWLLFALGGTQISDTKPGWKGWRRYILPFFYFLMTILVAIWWQALLVMGIAIGVYSLGYGKLNTWQRFVLGLLYALISVPLGLSWWNAITALMFGTLFMLSNTSVTANLFVWSICEGFFGLFVGIQLAYTLMGKGLTWIIPH